MDKKAIKQKVLGSLGKVLEVEVGARLK